MTGPAEHSPGEVPLEGVRWKQFGALELDEAGDLKFPDVDAVPGIYRFTIDGGAAGAIQYIGQAARSLRTRFGLYRSRGRWPALPLAKKTTSRNARYLLEALKAGHSVHVDLLDNEAAGPGGQIIMIDLADKAIRSRLEKELILHAHQAGTPLLNYAGNPGRTTQSL